MGISPTIELPVHLAMLVAAALVFLFTAKVWREGDWRKGFGPEQRISALVRNAARALWASPVVIVIACLVSLLRYLDSQINSWVYSRVNQAVFQRFVENCQSYYQDHDLASLFENFTDVVWQAQRILSNLSSPMEVMTIGGMRHFRALVLMLGVLALLALYIKKIGDAPVSPRTGLFAVALVAGIFATVLVLEYSFFLNQQPDFLILLPTGVLYALGLATFSSVWLALLFQAGKRWRNKISGEPAPSFTLSSVMEDALACFPGFVIMVALQAIPTAILFLSVYSPLNHEATTYDWWRALLSTPQTIFAWALFPLPILCLVYRDDEKGAWPKLLPLWKLHFRKLITLAAAVVVLEVLGAWILDVAIALPLLPYRAVEECRTSFYFPDPMNLLGSAAFSLLSLLALLTVVLAFQSNALDLPAPPPSENLPAPEPEPPPDHQD